jgi:Tol biopolymer transport system component
LIWRSGTALVSQVTVFDRKGNRTGVAGSSLPVDVIRLSPDESHLIVSGETGSWIVEANGPGQVRLEGRLTKTLWSPDGSRLIFVRGNKLFERTVSGSGDARELGEIPLDSGRDVFGISPDGRRILFGEAFRLSLAPLDGKGAPEQVVGQLSDNAQLSPDGMWVVYKPNFEPGIYAKAVSGASLPRQVADGGLFPVWRADGKEILFVRGARNQLSIDSVRVAGSGVALRFSAPVTLFTVVLPMGIASGSRPFAISRDGSRIYLLQSPEQPDAGVINVRIGAIR